MRLAPLCVLALAAWCISAVAVRDTDAESSIPLGGKAAEFLPSSAGRSLRYNGYGGGGYPYGNRGFSYGGGGYPNGRGGYPNSYGGYASGYGGSGYPYGGGYPNSYGGYPSGYGGGGYPLGGSKQKQFGPGPTPGFGGGPYCRYGQATSLAPYGMSSANRCGAFSASTYPFINPLSYPGIGRKLTQYLYPGAGGPGGGITVVNSNPVSVSNPVNVFNPNRNFNVGFGGPGGILGLLGRRKQA